VNGLTQPPHAGHRLAEFIFAVSSQTAAFTWLRTAGGRARRRGLEGLDRERGEAPGGRNPGGITYNTMNDAITAAPGLPG
jgi:hypothetical protein